MINIPKNHLYARINKALDGRATIGGGALRSYFEGNIARDIDIFMKTNDADEASRVVMGVLSALNIPEDTPPMFSKNGYFTRDYLVHAHEPPFISTIVSFINPQELTGRLLYGTPEELANEYDLSPVRCSLLPDNSVYFADGEEEYFRLFNSKQMKVRGNVQNQERTQKRIEKYEGYGYNLIGEI